MQHHLLPLGIFSYDIVSMDSDGFNGQSLRYVSMKKGVPVGNDRPSNVPMQLLGRRSVFENCITAS